MSSKFEFSVTEKGLPHTLEEYEEAINQLLSIEDNTDDSTPAAFMLNVLIAEDWNLLVNQGSPDCDLHGLNLDTSELFALKNILILPKGKKE